MLQQLQPLAPASALLETQLLRTALPKPLQAGLWTEIPDLKMASNAPFGLTSFALSLLLVFR